MFSYKSFDMNSVSTRSSEEGWGGSAVIETGIVLQRAGTITASSIYKWIFERTNERTQRQMFELIFVTYNLPGRTFICGGY